MGRLAKGGEDGRHRSTDQQGREQQWHGSCESGREGQNQPSNPIPPQAGPERAVRVPRGGLSQASAPRIGVEASGSPDGDRGTMADNQRFAETLAGHQGHMAGGAVMRPRPARGSTRHAERGSAGPAVRLPRGRIADAGIPPDRGWHQAEERSPKKVSPRRAATSRSKVSSSIQPSFRPRSIRSDPICRSARGLFQQAFAFSPQASSTSDRQKTGDRGGFEARGSEPPHRPAVRRGRLVHGINAKKIRLRKGQTPSKLSIYTDI